MRFFFTIQSAEIRVFSEGLVSLQRMLLFISTLQRRDFGEKCSEKVRVNNLEKLDTKNLTIFAGYRSKSLVFSNKHW